VILYFISCRIVEILCTDNKSFNLSNFISFLYLHYQISRIKPCHFLIYQKSFKTLFEQFRREIKQTKTSSYWNQILGKDIVTKTIQFFF
jgi:hypothetical protein